MKTNRLLAVALAFAVMLLLCGCKSSDYKAAVELYNAGDYDAAKEAFSALGDYKDSTEYLADIPYQEAIIKFEAGDYIGARGAFKKLGDYKESANYLMEMTYQEGILFFNKGKWKSAKSKFEELGTYKDSEEYIEKIDRAVIDEILVKASALMDQENYSGAIKLLAPLESEEEAQRKLREAYELQYQLALGFYNDGDYDKAARAFSNIADYKDANTYYQTAKAIADRDRPIKQELTSGWGDIIHELRKSFSVKQREYYENGLSLNKNSRTIEFYLFDEERNEFAAKVKLNYYLVFDYLGSYYKASDEPSSKTAFVLGKYDPSSKSTPVSYTEITIGSAGEQYSAWMDAHQNVPEEIEESTAEGTD